MKRLIKKENVNGRIENPKCDMFIAGYPRAKITENEEGFVVIAKIMFPTPCIVF